MSIIDESMGMLDSEVFDEKGLKKKYTMQILRGLDKHLNAQGVTNRDWIKDADLLGSLTSWQWHPRTDADIHIVTDLDKFSEVTGITQDKKLER